MTTQPMVDPHTGEVTVQDPGEVADDPASTGEPSGVISEAQRVRLEAIARELGRDHDWMSALADRHGWASSTLIPIAEYEAFEDSMRTQAAAEDAAKVFRGE